MKKLRSTLFFLVPLLVATVLWAAGKNPTAIHPFAGSQEGDGFNLHVIDTNIGTAWELVDADTGFTPFTTDTTLKIASGNVNGDSALVHITGLRKVRLGASAGKRDTVQYYSMMKKVDGLDTVTTDSVFHSIEQVWIDSIEPGFVAVWATGQSPTIGPILRRITSTDKTNAIFSPIAHLMFGTDDTPLLESITYGMDYPGQLDTLKWSKGGVYAKIDTLLRNSRNKDTSKVYDITSLDALAVNWRITVVAGATNGGTYALTITPQVSIDSTTWTSVTPLISKTTSTTATTSQTVYQAATDSASLNLRASWSDIAANNFIRWILTYSVDKTTDGNTTIVNPYAATARYDSTRIVAQVMRKLGQSMNGISYELREYPNAYSTIDYTKNYVVRSRAYVTPASRATVQEFPGGMRLTPHSYLAVMAKADVGDTKGYVTIIGKRRVR
mgnify:FL=1